MSNFSYPNFPTSSGYMTDKIRQQYIQKAMGKKLLPENAHRMSQIISLDASNDINQPIQIWQLYSVLGQDRIVRMVRNFYQRVFAQEHWFRSVFAKVGGLEHHVNTQSSMWIDVMGGGLAYHGGEFRLTFHHTHNAMELMNDKGAQLWVKLMVETLNDPAVDMTDDSRVRPALNTFLSHFMSKYAEEFKFENDFESGVEFGEVNAVAKRKINLLNMSEDAIKALSESELREALTARRVDVSQYADKAALVSKALRL